MRDGMHAGMDVREVAEIVVLQEGGPAREVVLWLRGRNIVGRCAHRSGGRGSTGREPSGL